jgi:hypothetical protein
VDLEKIPQGPVLAYLDPSVRARWEAALLLPPETTPTADSLTAATGSWYLHATLHAQRLSDTLFAPVPQDTSPQAVIDEVSEMLASVEGHPDDIQLDLVRAAAVWALAPWDAAQTEAVASRIEHPGRAVLARLYQAFATTSDPAALTAACRTILDAAPAELPVLYRVVALALTVGVVAGSDAEGAHELTDTGTTALAGSDALTATHGLVALAASADEPRQTQLLRAALRRADDVGNGYLRNDVLADMLIPAALTGDASVLTEVTRKLLAADWQVLMEGLRRAIGPLVALAGPGLLTQLDEALWAAQRVVSADAGAPASHLDGVAATPMRVQVLANPAPAAATTHVVHPEPLYLAAEDLPGLALVQDSRHQGPDPADYAFAACEGLHSGFQVWLGEQTKPVWRLVDIRFVFADAERAAAYHAERLLANSEDNPPVADVPLVGEDCHVFGGTQHMGGTDIEMTMYFYVFRVNTVVVKLFVAQGVESTEPLHPEHLHILAQRIVTKINSSAD